MGANVLFDIAWKGTAVLLVACACAVALRRSSAGARHLLWSSALAGILVIPIFVIAGPVWRVEVLPDPVARTFMVRDAADHKGLPNTEPVGLPVARTLVPVARTVLPVARTLTVRDVRWPTLFTIVWAVGALLGLLRLAGGLLWATWMTRRADAIESPEWQALLADAAASIGIRRRVVLRMSDRVSVPVTCGMLSPALVVPVSAADWQDARRRAVLLHELAHIARHDCLVQALGHAARALHWFNPLAFVALRRLREEQERACDDRVLGVGLAAADYARHLCDVASGFRSRRSPEWATLAMARPSNLESRIRAILNRNARRHAPGVAPRAVAALVMVAAVPLSALQLAAIAVPALPSVARVVAQAPNGRPEPITSTGAADAVARTVIVREASSKAWTHGAQEDEPAFEATVPDFSGTWVLDTSRSGSPTSRDALPLRAPQWGDVVVIRQVAGLIRVEAQHGETKASTLYALDDLEHRYLEEHTASGGGVSLRGSDVRNVWDHGKLVTVTRPFSMWVSDERDAAEAPNRSGMEFVNIRSLSADGEEMTVERVNRHDWGWGFDGREPSAAYARVTDVYRRATP